MTPLEELQQLKDRVATLTRFEVANARALLAQDEQKPQDKP